MSETGMPCPECNSTDAVTLDWDEVGKLMAETPAHTQAQAVGGPMRGSQIDFTGKKEVALWVATTAGGFVLNKAILEPFWNKYISKPKAEQPRQVTACPNCGEVHRTD